MSDTQKHTKSNVPNLRFPGFEGEWNRRTIAECCSEFQSGKFIKADAIANQGLYPVYGGNGLRGYTDSYNHEGDYTLIGRQGALCGNIRFVGGRTYVTEHAIAVKASKDNDTQFLSFLLDKMNLRQYSDQSAQPGLAVNKLLRVNINVPQLEEQKRIAQFLSILDQRIAIQSKVIEHYESLIKALAYEIIGKHKPNVLLTDIVSSTSSTLKESDLSEKGDIPAYGAAGLSGYTNQCLSESDSILITKDGSGIGSLRYVSGRHSFVGTLNSLAPKEGVYLPYVYYALLNVNFEIYKTGQAIPHIYFKDYGKESLYCPAYKSQIRLANGLELINERTEHEITVLRRLQTIKAYLLSALFI